MFETSVIELFAYLSIERLPHHTEHLETRV